MDRFPGVDQMHAFVDDLPDWVTVETIGRSHGGDRIDEVRVGSGPNHVIVIGSPHSNEPIGLLTVQHLLRLLCADRDLLAEMAATWHFVPCADPDGTRLNEGWYAGPFTRENVARHVYRPPFDEQPEWTFPVEWQGKKLGNPTPETQALMTLIDRTRPALIVSLHNADFGGGFFYVGPNGGDTSYYSALHQLLVDAGIPPHLSEPDAPGARSLHPGVFEMPSIEQMCDTMAAAGADPLALFPGGCSRDYAARYGTAFLVCELPLWTDARADDETPGDQTLREAMLSAAAAYRELHAVVTEVLDRVHLSGRSPFQRAVVEFLPSVLAMAQAKEGGAVDSRTATKAEIFVDQLAFPSTVRLRVGGMLLRLLDDEGVVDERFASLYEKWCVEAKETGSGDLVPLDRLVAVQSAAIALAVTRIRDGLPV